MKTEQTPSLHQVLQAISEMNLIELEVVAARLGSISWALDKLDVSHIGEASEHFDAAADLIHQARRADQQALSQDARDAAEEARADALRYEA